MRDITVLKIGGSIATFKDRPEATPQIELLADIFNNIAPLRESLDTDLILIHGAGTYGHTLAKRFELSAGAGTNTNKILGAMETRRAVQELNTAILKIGHAACVPLCTVHPGTIAKQECGTELKLNTAVIAEAFERGVVPLLYGDMVPDQSWGFSVCSGDSIAAVLAASLPVSRIIFATDVDGVYSKDPYQHSDTSLIEQIRLSQFTDQSAELGLSHNVDVTDGFKGKIRVCKEMFANAQQLQEIHVFNGLTAENFTHALLGQAFSHTTITK